MLSGTTSALIVKIGAIGDVVMVLPAIRELKRQAPQARITWVCGRQIEPLLRQQAVVDELVVVDESALYGKRGVLHQLYEAAHIALVLAFRKFDIGFVPYHDSRYRLLTSFARVRKRLPWGSGANRHPPIPGRYHGSEAVRAFTGVDTPTMDANSMLRRAGESVQRRAPGQRPVVVLAPGGAKNDMREEALRRWPLECYAQLAAGLVQEGCTVRIVGAPSDDWVRSAFADMPVEDLVGQTNLLGLMALLKDGDVLVTHDSGPLHLGYLVGMKCVALFGPTMPSEKVPPGGPVQVHWGGASLNCRPCYDGRSYAACADAACMRDIQSKDVLRSVREALKQIRGGSGSQLP